MSGESFRGARRFVDGRARVCSVGNEAGTRVVGLRHLDLRRVGGGGRGGVAVGGVGGGVGGEEVGGAEEERGGHVAVLLRRLERGEPRVRVRQLGARLRLEEQPDAAEVAGGARRLQRRRRVVPLAADVGGRAERRRVDARARAEEE